MKVGDIVMIRPIAEDDEHWWEDEETWGSWGVITHVDLEYKYPYLVEYIPWQTKYGLCSDDFSKEELTHLSRMNVR